MRLQPFALLPLIFVGCTAITALEPTECRSHRVCEVLNEAAGGCTRWQCSGNIAVEEFDPMADPLDAVLTAGTCVLQREDLDGDGFASPACEAELTADQVDCNDLSAAVLPGATEICDGRDNNCDGVIDEGVTPDPLEDPVRVEDLPSFTEMSGGLSGGALSIVFADASDSVYRLRSSDWLLESMTPHTQPQRPGLTSDEAIHFLAMEETPGCWRWRSPDDIEEECTASGACDPGEATIVDQCIESGGRCLPMQRAMGGQCGATRAWGTTVGDAEIIAFERRAGGALHVGLTAASQIRMPGPPSRSGVFGGLDLSLDNDFDAGVVGRLAMAGGDTSALLAWTQGDGAGACSAAPVRWMSVVTASHPASGQWLTAPNEGQAESLPDAIALAATSRDGALLLATSDATGVTLRSANELPSVMVSADERDAWVEAPYDAPARPMASAISELARLPIANATGLRLQADPAGGLIVVARTGCDETSQNVVASVIATDGSSEVHTLAEGVRAKHLDAIFDSLRSEWVAVWIENADTASAAMVAQRLASDGTPLSRLEIPIAGGSQAFLYVEDDALRAAAVVDRGANARIEAYQVTCAE